MSDYAEVRLSILASTNADMTPAFLRGPTITRTYTPDETLAQRIEAATAPGTVVTTTYLASASLLAVRNKDATNYVTATFLSAGNGATSNILRIPAGGLLLIEDFTPSGDLVLVANSAVCLCDVWLFGT